MHLQNAVNFNILTRKNRNVLWLFLVWMIMTRCLSVWYPETPAQGVECWWPPPWDWGSPSAPPPCSWRRTRCTGSWGSWRRTCTPCPSASNSCHSWSCWSRACHTSPWGRPSGSSSLPPAVSTPWIRGLKFKRRIMSKTDFFISWILITIYAPMFYTAPCIMFWMRA